MCNCDLFIAQSTAIWEAVSSNLSRAGDLSTTLPTQSYLRSSYTLLNLPRLNWRDLPDLIAQYACFTPLHKICHTILHTMLSQWNLGLKRFIYVHTQEEISATGFSCKLRFRLEIPWCSGHEASDGGDLTVRAMLTIWPKHNLWIWYFSFQLLCKMWVPKVLLYSVGSKLFWDMFYDVIHVHCKFVLPVLLLW